MARSVPQFFCALRAFNRPELALPSEAYDQRLSGDVTVNVIASIIASLVLLAAVFSGGKQVNDASTVAISRIMISTPSRSRENFPEFNLKDFRLGMHYFLKNNDYTAARQLIFIGEQNNVRAQLEPSSKRSMPAFSRNMRAKKIADDTTSIWKIMSGLFV